ncbi:MAG: MaoC family dehydratase N-terminal domain-containing protein [Mobilicoccus sp.]|nr:MaoC family dehydratase N-terminal domain-containing protein [Mobilicoccus sp.]
MPVNTAYEGRSYPPGEPFAVGREHVRAFADAVGATDPLHRDVAAAREAGFADVVAPPTFAVVIAQRAEQQYIADPEAGIDFTRVVHGEESFTHHRPLVAGSEVRATLHVDRVREVGGHGMVSTRVEIADDEGDVCTVRSSLVVRGE